MVGSAAAVAFASVLYSIASGWETGEEHEMLRVSAIIIARVLIEIAVRISAALVASLTKGSPEDGALDASGAFLTWASAIWTRIYHEAFRMTLTAIGFYKDVTTWDAELREFLRPDPSQHGASGTSCSNDSSTLEKLENDIPESSTFGIDQESPVAIPMSQRLFGGRMERRLLILNSCIYVGVEVAEMVLHLIALIGDISQKPGKRSPFVPDDEAGQCGVRGEDAPCKF